MLYIICGHGGGDPGACAGGYQEADLVRKLAAKMKEFAPSQVNVLDTSVDWYKTGGISYLSIGNNPLVELHMDSASGAQGGHVIIPTGGSDSYDRALADFISCFFPGRSRILVERSDLANPNRAKARGVNYRLVECGFISDDGDRNKFIYKMDDLARGILWCFDIKALEPERIEEKRWVGMRLAGDNRYGTNSAVVKAFESEYDWSKVVIFRDGADGYAIANIPDKYPKLMVNDNPDSNGGEKAILTKHKGEIKEFIVIGGTAVLPDAVVNRLNEAAGL